MNTDHRRPGGGPPYRQGPGQRPAPQDAVDPKLAPLLARISLREPAAELFDTVAQQIAEILARGGSNKSSQIRRFYDEVTRYADRTRGNGLEQFRKVLPFIRMINARVAYAAQRKVGTGTLVDQNFQEFMKACLGQVDSSETLQMFRSLFEAVIGFSPRDR